MIPKVSIIVPVYNVEKYIERCMNSLLNQTLSDIEIILVDDESPDNCPQLCDDYAKNDARVKVIHKKNGGLGFARNSGVEIATGEFVGFVDSDDYVSLNYYEILYAEATKTSSDICICGNYDVNEDSCLAFIPSTAGNVFTGDEINKKLLPSLLGYDLYGDDYTGMSACRGIFKRQIFVDNEIKFMSEREMISEDAIFDMDFYPKCKRACVISYPGYYYCHNGTSLTTSYNPNRFVRYEELFEFQKEKASKMSYSNILIERITSMFLANMRVTIMQEVSHSFKDSKKAIQNIVNSDKVIEVLSTHPINKMKLAQRLFCIGLKYKQINLVRIMAYLKARKK